MMRTSSSLFVRPKKRTVAHVALLRCCVGNISFFSICRVNQQGLDTKNKNMWIRVLIFLISTQLHILHGEEITVMLNGQDNKVSFVCVRVFFKLRFSFRRPIPQQQQKEDQDPVERAEVFCAEFDVQSTRDCVITLSKEILAQRYDKESLSLEHGIEEQREQDYRASLADRSSGFVTTQPVSGKDVG